MFHLDNNSGVSAMPPVGAVQSSAPRWFTEGGGGTPASFPGADWFNIIQAELLNLISAYGVALNKSDFNQLQKAIEEAIKQKATASSALLTAIAALVTSADKMPYFTGKDKVSMADLTSFAREILAQTDAAGVLSKLGLGDANGYVGRKIAEQWITSSKLLTLNPRTEYFKAVITGAGGGGGGAFNGGGANDNFSGGGGAAGGTGIKWFRVADVTNWAVVIGSGGTEATKGGDSSFSGIVAPGGAPSVASTVFAAGGTGVAGTGADINWPGGDGGDGQNGAYLLSGFGGASYWGGSRRAGQGQSGSTTIPKAEIPGGGGGGAFDTQKMGVRFYGGQGADGICFIEEYA